MTPARPPRRWPRASRTIDGAIVAGLVVLDLIGMIARTAGVGVKSPPLRPYEVAAAVGSAALFWWRRERPITVLLLSLAAIIVAAAPFKVALASQSTGLTAALATYAVGSWARPRLVSIAIPAVLFAALFVAARGDGWGVAFAVAAAVIALPWVAGYAARSHRLYTDEVEARLVAVERERDERAERAARDERAHIARELHDIAAHHVSVIGVQAGAARVALERSPEDTRTALMAIETASRDAIHEMRHLLSALREPNDRVGPGEAPQPGLSSLDGLVESFRAAGITVDLSRTGGEGTTLAPSLDLCCYRIIEEALTNVTRHSSAHHASVAVDTRENMVRVTILDPGPADAKPGTGRGHIGMRERVALFGGQLAVGPLANGGFVVDATLPRTLAAPR